MNKEEFEFLLKQGGGLKLEFKEEFDSKNLGKELVAFANTEGGRVFLGVNEVDIFDDRVEISNPGALPKPYEELQKGDISLPRNPIITKIFRIIDLAENAGYGFDKMFKGWRYHYSKEPIVSTGLDYYKIEFFFGVEELEKTVETGGLTGGLTEVRNLIKSREGIKAKEIAQELKRPLDTVDKQIRSLVNKGIIIRKGSKKTGGYFIKSEEKGGKR